MPIDYKKSNPQLPSNREVKQQDRLDQTILFSGYNLGRRKSKIVSYEYGSDGKGVVGTKKRFKSTR